MKEEIQKEFMEQCVDVFNGSNSIRQAAKSLEISPMKLRKILITAGVFESEMSEEIRRMDEAGKTIEEIAEIQHMSKACVYSYLTYRAIVYNLPVKSKEAERQKKYRNNKKEKIEVDDELLKWLNNHPGIVADLKRRSGIGQNPEEK